MLTLFFASCWLVIPSNWPSAACRRVVLLTSVVVCVGRFVRAAPGSYTVTIVAVDVLGNSGTAVVVTFGVDREPPTSFFVTAPARYTRSHSVEVTVAAADSQSVADAFVRVDGGDWLPTPANGSITLSGLSGGAHVVEVSCSHVVKACVACLWPPCRYHHCRSCHVDETGMPVGFSVVQ